MDELGEIFEFDRSTKRIRDRAFGSRAVIINERFWNRLTDELLDLLKDQGPLILYHMWASYGFEAGAHAYRAEKDTASTTRFCSTACSWQARAAQNCLETRTEGPFG